ncbi:hypothetical protein M501DRAFT_1015177 [Patellaria atrata CBS 101060]|uniref:IEC3 subunit of the Ino80 complex, chromatin re-modelling-domain-containing protein n=1 Tax=Patellaria atrata CBS 101060 TaxID=1346257 RepID=A0A9P4SCI3_9PEZI|nr:hypothetical protein M501DRAFT_1015177 [Patellaria atrata CBS 101060]
MASLSHIVSHPAHPEPIPVTDWMDTDPQRQSKKSMKRKYVKLRHKFDRTMMESNALFKEEHKAWALARRLQEQNDQLMEILLDLNESVRVPNTFRFDLRSPSPSTSAVPSLETDDDLDPEAIQRALREARAELVSGEMSAEEYAAVEASLTQKLVPRRPKALASLLKTPHTRPLMTHDLPADLFSEETFGVDLPGYLTPNHEEEYLLALDTTLTDPFLYNPDDAIGRPIPTLNRPIPSDRDISLNNPNSVYNWLRRNQPSIFLQDHENASEKSGPKGGSARSAAKRASIAAASVATPSVHKTEQDLLDEEIGFVPETGHSSGRGKRSKDDEPYRPKGGQSRTTKRKRDDGDKGSRKKAARSSNAGLDTS